MQKILFLKWETGKTKIVDNIYCRFKNYKNSFIYFCQAKNPFNDKLYCFY